MMAMVVLLQIISLLLGAVRLAVSDGTFTIQNNCAATIWLGVVSSAGIQPLTLDNTMLSTGQTMTVTTPSNWGGRFWGRTGCSRGTDGTFTCAMGDCDGREQCTVGGKPPATLVEFTLSGYANMDFYDVSLVDGYNLPMAVSPDGGGQGRNATDPKSCGAAGCTGDLNRNCPAALQVTGTGNVVGCRSACDAFKEPQYCCTGENALPTTCKPTDYSKAFKQSCPNAYSYAYDDLSSTFTCMGGRYTIVFCPTATDLSDDNNGVQFPEAQAVPAPAVPSTDGGDNFPVGGSSPTVGTNFRIISPSSAPSRIQSLWWPLGLALGIVLLKSIS
ncbi:pathogenesis-related protein 5 isoform X1 [Selaginella moellendorffii]|uniref:pathogenesis-related protein 5 isoform X1 n=1 Tax=Selaginella moellendorffii TaxID=88036 RepID=UPI000D1C8126|nr:pathogenesis-related protein 5 isoform X1 [Selaginella moellendorffii]|eukprot:XP_002979720.2 pathogenesis-related protein 5 isoform X1 [Selaginella moellendorffii]